MSRPFLRRLTGAVLIPIYAQTLLLSCGSPPATSDDADESTTAAARTTPGLPSYPPNTVQKARAPIKLRGGGGVTDAGTATYSIPIGVPAGPHGMEPALSLSYGGNANGHLGVGWGLGGLSAITPCAKTFAADGTADGVDRDGTDAFCLDGQRLIAPGQGYAPPPAAGDTLYHTAVESFRRVVAHPDASTGGPMPGSFTVYERDGRVAAYLPVRGEIRTNEHAHSTPVLASQRVPAFYLLDTILDLDGNLIRYRYEDADSQLPGELSRRIKSIDYAFTGATPTRTIAFGYESRPDPIISHAGGMTTVVRSRLVSITMHAPNPTVVAPVWRYFFTYTQSADTRRSLLQSVRLYDQFDASSWVRSFTYSQADGGLAEHVAPELEFTAKSMSWDVDTVSAYHDNPEAQWVAATDVRVLLYDADADGDDDMLYRTKASWLAPWLSGVHPDEGIARWTGLEDGSQDYPAYARFGGHLYFRETGLAPAPGPRTLVDDQLEPGMDDMLELDGFSIAHLGKTRVADTDGDGKLSLVLAMTRVDFSGDWTADDTEYLDTWDYGFASYDLAPGGPAVTGVDTVLMHGTVVRKAPSEMVELGVFTPPFQRVIADLDGDARPEALEVNPGPVGIDVTVDDGVDWNDPFVDHEPYGFGYHAWPTTDLEHAVPSARWSCNNGQMVVADADGDGRQDVLAAELDVIDPTHHYQGIYRKISLADATGTAPHGPVLDDGGTSMLWGGDCGAHDPDLVMGDWNGDGLVDALYPPGSYTDESAGYVSGVNTEPLVRWNLGNGFGPIESMPVAGVSGITALLRQDAPLGKFGLPVVWDRGTRTADVNGDGRTDIIAFRQDNATCVDGPLQVGGAPNGWGCENKVVVYRSAGDHFEGEELASWPKAGASLAHGFSTAQVGDVTGDGAVDVVHVVEGHLTLLELPWRTTPDLLVTVVDGSAAYPLETFERTRAWWGDAEHSQSANPPPCAWPLSCPRRGFEVVRTHRTFAGTRPDGSAMYSTDVHAYVTPRQSLLGRGSLGFFQHRIWNRELGSETVRVFQHAVADPFGATDYAPSLVFLFGGSLFYPGTRSPSLEYTVTPRIATPSAAQLASTSLAPGLTGGAPVPVRVVSTERTFELRANPAGSQITQLPETTTVVEVDNTATPDLATTPGTPGYTGVDLQAGGDRRQTTTTYQHDVLGNPISITTVVRGAQGSPVAATRRTETTYVSCPGEGCPVAAPDAWITGMPVRVAVADFDADDPVLPVPPARVVRATYDAKGRPSEIRVNAAGTDYLSCAANTPDPETCEAKSTTTTIVYTPHGNVEETTQVAFDNPLPRTTTTSWDADGVYPTATIDPANLARILLHHPGLGVPVVSVDENAMIATATFDGFGRVVSTSTPGKAIEIRSYSEVVNGTRRGVRIETSSQAGSFESETTDELSRTIESSVRGFGPADMIRTTTEYDPFGNVVAQTRPSFTTGAPAMQYRYDRLARTTRETSPAPVNAITEMAHTMFTRTTTDPEGHKSYVNRDLEGRIVESGHLLGTTPHGEVRFTYGIFDRVATMIDAAGNVSTRGYDAFGRPATLADPDTGLSTLHYDGFGDVRTEVIGADTITHTYDALGRPLVTIDSAGNTETLGYDTGTGAKGRLVSATSTDNVTTGITYDSFGRTRQITQTVDGTPHSVVHRYDDYGRLRHLFYPVVAGFDRFTLGYTYNANGYLTHINDVSWCGIDPNYSTPPPGCLAPNVWKVEERDAWLGLTRARFGNNQLVTRDLHDDTGRLEHVTAAGITLDYIYDDDGLLLQRKEADRVEDFVHDELHRLTAWTIKPPKGRSSTDPPPVTTDYHYSELGNLDLVKRGGVETFSGTFSPSKPHQLTASTVGGTYAYDERGRQESGGGRTTVWNDDDLPATITTAGVTRTFRYSAFGHRAKRSEPGAAVTYVGKLFEHRVTGAVTRDTFYVHGDPGVVAQVDYQGTLKTTRYIVGDPLGSPIVFEKGSAVVERNYYDPFGGRVDTAGAPIADPDLSTSIGFTGHEDDGGGLINMGGRIYDRAQYRFLTPDPVIGNPLFGQAHNPYSYVYNSPLSLVDPSGLSAVDSVSPDSAPVETASTTISAAEPIAPPPPPAPPAATTNANCEPAGACQAGKTIQVSGTASDDSGASASEDEAPAAGDQAQSGESSAWTDNGASGAPGYLPEDAADYSGDGFEESGLLLAAPVLIYYLGPGLFGTAIGRFALFDLLSLSTWEGHSADSNNVPILPGAAFEEGLGILGKALGLESRAAEACAGSGICKGLAECFGAGTPVLTPDGSVPIETLEEGDAVVAYDPATGTTAARRVVRTFVHDGVTLELTLRPVAGPDTSLRATAEHPFLRCDGAFVGASALAAGDCVVTARSTATVIAVGEPDVAEPVFNVEVETDHTYIVGDAEAVVHNQCAEKNPFGLLESIPGRKGPHVMQLQVTRDGKLILDSTIRSGGQSAEEALLGFPWKMLITHTERRVSTLPFQAGDLVELYGTKSPCWSCQRAMAATVEETGATVRYYWDGKLWTP